jgi:pimeloyl-ACP methyl ester carboxylesterase
MRGKGVVNSTRADRRLPPSRWYPAGVAGIATRRVVLPDGCALRVCEAGPADGPPLLLLHGWGATVYLWNRNILDLAAAGIRVIVPDLPGHGLSDAPDGAGEYTLERFVFRVRALLDALGVARATVAGQSMAGKVALALARDHPARVASVMLFGAIGFGPPPPWRAWAPFFPLPASSIASRLVPRWSVAFVQQRVRGRLQRATREDIDMVWAPSQFPAIVRAQMRMAIEFDWALWTEDELRRITTPVHVVFGTRDRTVDPRRAEPLASALPDGRFTWIPDGGHVVMEEAPERITAMLRDAVTGPRLDSAR